MSAAIEAAGAAQVGDSRRRGDGLLDVEAARRPAARGLQVRSGGVEECRDALHAAGSAVQAVRKRGELA
jgi:hypothetical protein